MKNYQRAVVLLSVLICCLLTQAQNNKPVTDYLKLAGPIVFEKQSYHLAWTSHPSDNFYKQEYIPQGEILTKFKKMMLIDVLTGSQNIKDVIGNKIAELNKMRQINPMVNYEVLENAKNGEYILDFLLSQNSPDGNSIAIVERNVYRYKSFTDKSGNKGILLFGISSRSYGKEVEQFLAHLKSNRKELISSVSQFTIPAISVSQ